MSWWKSESKYTGFNCSYCGFDYPPKPNGGFLDDFCTDKGTRCPKCGRFYCGGCLMTKIPQNFTCQCGQKIT